MLSDQKAESLTFQDKLNEEAGRSKSVEGEKELLREQIMDLRKVGPSEYNFIISYAPLFFNGCCL